MIDFKKAMQSPEDVFKDPAAILLALDLLKEQKIQLLKQWEHDLLELEVAEEENMPSDDISERLSAVPVIIKGNDKSMKFMSVQGEIKQQLNEWRNFNGALQIQAANDEGPVCVILVSSH